MKFFLLVGTLFAQPLFADTGGHISDGGGLAEAHVAYTYLSLEKFVDLCVAKPECARDERETNFLRNLVEVTEAERIKIKPVFKAEHEHPGFFLENGKELEFRTASQLGEVIYFNLDKLYRSLDHERSTALSLPEIVGITVKALASHVVHDFSAEELTDLGVRLGRLDWKNVVQMHAPRTDFAPDAGLVFYVERKAEADFFPLVLSDYTSVFDYTKSFKQAVVHAGGFSDSAVAATRFQQGRWLNLNFGGSDIQVDFVVKMQVVHSDPSKSMLCQATLKVWLEREKDLGRKTLYVLDEAKTFWSQTSCQ